MGILKITALDTVVGDGFTEIKVNTFFENLDKNIGEEYAVYYEKERAAFKIIYEGKTWYLKLSENDVEDFEFGLLNCYTNNLKKLMDKTDLYNRNKEEKKAAKEKAKQEKARVSEEQSRLQRVFKDAESGILPTNREDLMAYLNHLEQSQKLSITNILDSLYDFDWDFGDMIDTKIDVFEDWLDSWLEKLRSLFSSFNVWGEDVFKYSLKILVIFTIIDIFLILITLIVIFFFPTFIHKLIGGQLFIDIMTKLLFGSIGIQLVPMSLLGIPFGMTFGSFIKEFGSFIKEKKEDNELKKHKIQTLKRLLKMDYPPKRMKFDVELWPNLQSQMQSCKIKDFILQDFYKLLNMAKHLNERDKQRLEKEIMEQIELYEKDIARFQQADLDKNLKLIRASHNLKESGNMLGSETQLEVKAKYIEKITGLEMEIIAIRRHDIEIRQLKKDLSYLGDKQYSVPYKPIYRNISGYQCYDTNKVYSPNLNDPKTVLVLKRVRQKNK